MNKITRFCVYSTLLGMGAYAPLTAVEFNPKNDNALTQAEPSDWSSDCETNSISAAEQATCEERVKRREESAKNQDNLPLSSLQANTSGEDGQPPETDGGITAR